MTRYTPSNITRHWSTSSILVIHCMLCTHGLLGVGAPFQRSLKFYLLTDGNDCCTTHRLVRPGESRKRKAAKKQKNSKKKRRANTLPTRISKPRPDWFRSTSPSPTSFFILYRFRARLWRLSWPAARASAIWTRSEKKKQQT